jgi:tetratricopeptide (TPR) repeat protein
MSKTITSAKEKVLVEIPVDRAQKSWQYQLAFWGLGILLFFPPYFRGLFFPVEQQYVLILAAALFWLVCLGKHSLREYAFLSHPMDYFVLVFPLVYFLAAFNAVNYGLAVDEIVKNVIYFLVYWIVVQLVREEAALLHLLHVIYLAAVGVALAGLATATGLVNIKDGFVEGRIYSSFQYPNALASYLALAVFLGFFFWSKNSSLTLAATITDRTLKKILPKGLLKLRPYGYLYSMANFILLAVLFGTKSRGGLLITGVVFMLYLIGLNWQKRLPVTLHALFTGGFGYFLIYRFIAGAQGKQMGMAWLWIAAGLVAILLVQAASNFLFVRNLSVWLKEQKRVNGALAGLAAVLIGALGAIFTLRPLLWQKIISFDYLRNAFERTYFIKDALAMIRERPVLGWGGGGWEEAYRAFQGYLYNSNEVHSYYFQVAVETGLVGLLTILGIWAVFFWAAHRAYRAASAGIERKTLIWTLFTGALAVGGHAVIDFDLSLSALTIALWTIFASVRVLDGLPVKPAESGKVMENMPLKSKQGLPTGKGSKKKKPAGMETGKAKKNISKKEEKNTSQKSKRAGLPPAQPVLLAVYSLVSVLLLILGITLASASAYARLASQSLQTGNLQKGLAYSEKAITYNPFNAEHRANLPLIYSYSGKPEMALAEAQRTVALSQYSAAQQIGLASAYLANEKNKEAVDCARRAIELAPYQITWYEALANLYSLAGQRELVAGNNEAARQYLEETLKVPVLIQDKVAGLGEEEKRLWKDAPMLAPTPGVQLYTGQANYLLNQLVDAEKDFQAAAKDEQTKGEALIWLALIKEKQGKAQEAQELVKQAEGLNKAYVNTYEQIKKLPVLS